MLVFHCGNIDRVEVVLLYSGVCKVNAAIAAQLLIDCFAVDCIINAGTAGGIQEQVQLFDTVISERIAYHDVADDILTEFHPWMDSVYFYADENLLQSAKAYSNTTKRVILFGTMVSGEQFVTEENREQILTGFTPLCTDMETAAVRGYGDGECGPCLLCEQASLSGHTHDNRYGGAQRNRGI